MNSAIATPNDKTCSPNSAHNYAIPEGLAVVAEADLVEAGRLLSQFRAAGIDAYVGGKECCSSGGCGPKAAVLVPIAELPLVRDLLESNWRRMIAHEGGDPDVLQRVAAAESEGLPVCPACGHVGEPVSGECGDCGLALG